MSLADIRHEVFLTLAQTREAEREARWALANGTYVEKVVAAGELDFLTRQESTLEDRLHEIDRRLSGPRTVFAWVRQTGFNLRLGFESWIAHG